MTKQAWPGIPASFPPPPDLTERGPAGPTGATGATGDTGPSGGSGAPQYHNSSADVDLDDVDSIVRCGSSDPKTILLPTATGNIGRIIRVYRYGAGSLNIFAESGNDIEHAAGNSDTGYTLSGWSAEFISTGSGTWLTRVVA